MKRLLTSLMVGCMLTLGGVFFVVPVVAHAQSNIDSSDLVIGTKKADPYSACETGLTGLGDVGCQFGMFLVYGVWFRFTNALASLGAYFADYFLWFSLQSTLYRFGDLMSQGWSIVRNFVNIGFIVALLYAGWQFLFGKGGSSRLLVRIILSALLVNFSLFGARLIIDAGNITARAIYTQIKISGVNGSQEIAAQNGKVEISQGLLNISNPQAVLFKEIGGQDDDFIWKMFTMFFLSGILNIFLIIIFLSMALLFVTRTISLILLGILVPIPIVVDLIPPVKAAVQKLKTVGSVLSFENWLTEYFKLSMMAPVYCFFLYLIIMVQSGYSKIAPLQPTLANGNGMIGVVFAAMLPTVITFFLIRMASSITKDFSGAFGALITQGISSAVGFVGGLAMTGIAAGASRVGGLAGKALQKSAASGMTPEERDAKIAAARERGGISGKLAQIRLGAGAAAQARTAGMGNYLVNKATYDPRNIRDTGAFKSFAGSAIGRAALNEAGQQVISGVSLGKGSQLTYDQRDMQRVEEAEKRRKADTAEIHQAMDDVNKRAQKEMEEKRKNRPHDEPLRTAVEARANAVLEARIPPTDAEVKAAELRVRTSEDRVKDLTKQYEKETDPTKKARIYQVLQQAKIAEVDAKDKLAEKKFDKDNMAASSVAQLEQEVRATERGGGIETARAEAKKEREDLEKEKKANDKKYNDLNKKKAEVEKLERIAKAPGATAQQKTDAKNARDEYDKDRIEKEQADADARKKEADIKEKEEKADKAEKELGKKKKAIEERTKKSEELQKSVNDKTYMDNNPEAKVYAQASADLKEKYLKEKDPVEKQKILAEMHAQGAYVSEQRGKKGANDSFHLSFEAEMLNQHDLNKKVASHLVAEDMIRDMQQSYSNMGRAMAATLAGTTAAALTVGAVAALPALVTGLVVPAVGLAVGQAVTSAARATTRAENTMVGMGSIGTDGRSNNTVAQVIDRVQSSIDSGWARITRSASQADVERAMREAVR